MSSTQQATTIITYINSKGAESTYDTASTGVAQKVGQKDAKILAEKHGVFPYGKNPKTGKAYLNACGGKKRDESKGWFEKGDWCSVVGCMRHKDTAGSRPFDRRYPKAEHYKATCVGGKSAGKVRELGAGTGVSLKAIPEKKKGKFFGYLQYALECRSGNDQGKKFAYDKATDKLKAMCDSALGKVKVQVADITKACVLYKFKGADGKEVSNDTGGYKEITAKAVFTQFYKDAGKVLYAPEEEEDDDDDDDFFSEGDEEVGDSATEESATDTEAERATTDDEAEESNTEEEADTEAKKIDGRTKEGKALKAQQEAQQAE